MLWFLKDFITTCFETDFYLKKMNEYMYCKRSVHVLQDLYAARIRDAQAKSLVAQVPKTAYENHDTLLQFPLGNSISPLVLLK